jgi:uncharacterized protein
MKVLVTGASGFVGQAVCAALAKAGHEVLPFSRSGKAMIPHDVEALINLAGENVSGRWTDSKKKRIVESRTSFIEHLSKRFEDFNNLETVISASAVGFYGNRGDELLTESSNPGAGFLADVCKQWESTVENLFSQSRVVIFRIGVVLGDGGALDKMKIPFKLGLGAPLGSGAQWMSWISIDDLAKLFVFALDNPKLKGTFNAVSPEPATNSQFSQALAKALHRPLLPVGVPEFVLRLSMGEMAAIVLDSQKVSSAKIQEAGFQFSHPNLLSSLKMRH